MLLIFFFFFLSFSFNPVLPKGKTYFATQWKGMIMEKERKPMKTTTKKSIVMLE